MNNFFWFSIFVAANASILFILAANVSRLRMKFKISLGDGGNKALFDAIRAQANGVEQVPMFALIILALPNLDTHPAVLPILVLAFTAARIAHAIGMLLRVFLARRLGAGLSYLLQLVGIVILIVALL